MLNKGSAKQDTGEQNEVQFPPAFL